ncbi:unnamed protein product [Arabis nemorensis]|uniref:Uncharacterized protein n=1 Tax=Arabis nemorensis TaxID=586526 RepID=A0A565CDB1_9BRAS|nr:unnamed protein product [Arabis nemorensis]
MEPESVKPIRRKKTLPSLLAASCSVSSSGDQSNPKVPLEPEKLGEKVKVDNDDPGGSGLTLFGLLLEVFFEISTPNKDFHRCFSRSGSYSHSPPSIFVSPKWFVERLVILKGRDERLADSRGEEDKRLADSSGREDEQLAGFEESEGDK